MAIATKNQAPLSLKTHLLTFLQGLAIGSANAIPGVSGGTLALVFGIYEKLISSIKALAHKPFWQAVLKFRIAEAFKVVNGGFLSVLIAGALFALLTLARGLEWGFQSYPVYILSFFFGLILASVLPVSRYIKRWKPRTILAFIGGTLIGFVLVGLTPTNLPNTWPFLFFSGALAASAMIVPGISGAFILVLLGNYEYILGAVNGRDLGAIAIVGIGAVMGLLSLSQLLSWLFKRYHDTTLALLAGFMLGSLRKIWPWKTGGFSDTETPANIWPALSINGTLNSEVLVSIALIIFGAALVLILDFVGKKISTQTS
ncbi:MAG: DUF368 domain-containing protein [Trueperaceae bacterium]|nr:DUF368 domain-containing protein [Trueperaceae bacterium]